jgi:hypothetical protein
MRRTFKDFIGTSIGRREGRGVGRIVDKTKWEERSSGGMVGGGVWEREGVREPESIWSNLERNREESSSVVAGSWAGSTKGVPKTASVGDKLFIS